MTELESQIVKVRGYRALVSDQKEAINERMMKWQDENEALLASFDADKKELVEAENKLRELTLSAYQADPSNKKPAPGVGIRIVKIVKFDPKIALEWAMDKEACIMLDVKAFEKAAIAGIFPYIPATISEEAQATIAKELEAI
jgi:hypothetical protein